MIGNNDHSERVIESIHSKLSPFISISNPLPLWQSQYAMSDSPLSLFSSKRPIKVVTALIMGVWDGDSWHHEDNGHLRCTNWSMSPPSTQLKVSSLGFRWDPQLGIRLWYFLWTSVRQGHLIQMRKKIPFLLWCRNHYPHHLHSIFIFG